MARKAVSDQPSATSKGLRTICTHRSSIIDHRFFLGGLCPLSSLRATPSLSPKTECPPVLSALNCESTGHGRTSNVCQRTKRANTVRDFMGPQRECRMQTTAANRLTTAAKNHCATKCKIPYRPRSNAQIATKRHEKAQKMSQTFGPRITPIARRRQEPEPSGCLSLEPGLSAKEQFRFSATFALHVKARDYVSPVP